MAAAGKMPLTNYLLQTMICTTLFYGWGLGWWGKVGPAAQLALALGIFFLVQVPLSMLWLRRSRWGPLEYAWRVARCTAACRRSSSRHPPAEVRARGIILAPR